MGIRPQIDAQAALDAGGRIMARQLEEFPKPIDRADLQTARSLFTQAIELADTDSPLRAKSHFYRATAEDLLGEYEEALTDVQAAETLGALDIADIIPAKTMALVRRGHPEDLRLAINLLTLAMQLPPPQSTVQGPRGELLHRISTLELRAEGYERLEQFDGAIQDYRTALGLLTLP
jgi:tetratricopeptide (TPR) repeat protein